MAGLSLAVRGAPPEDPIVDGYAAWGAFASEVSALLEPHGDVDWGTVSDAMDDRDPLPEPFPEMLKALQPWWNRMGEIAHAPEWNHLPKEKLSPSTIFPEAVGGSLHLQLLARAEAYQRIQTGDVDGAIDLLLDLNRAGQRLAVSGGLIHGLLYQAGRRLSMPVLMRALEAYPDAKRQELHPRLRKQYMTLPTFHQITEGERFFMRNGVEMLFAEKGGMKGIPQDAMDPLIEHLRSEGVPEATLTAIRENRLLSPVQWRQQILAEVEAWIDMAYDDLPELPTREFAEHEERLRKRFDPEADWDMERIEHLGNQFEARLRNPVDSFGTLKKLHAEVGDELTRMYMQVLPVSVYDAARRYRAFQALEQLLLIESAQRVYVVRHQREPDALSDLVNEGLLTEAMVLDPLTGEPFRKMKGERVKWYSVGPDLEDDGGTDRMEKEGDWWLETRYPERADQK